MRRTSRSDALDNELARKLIGRSGMKGNSLASGSTAGSGSADDRDRDAFRNPMTSTGDLIVGGSSGEPKRLAVGADGDVPTAQADGTIAWEAPTGGGSDLDVSANGVTVNTVPVHTVNFDDPPFTVIEDGGDPGKISVGIPAEGVFAADVHTHAVADISDWGTPDEFSQDLGKGIRVPPGMETDDSTLTTTMNDGEPSARYLGQAPQDVTSIDFRLRVTTAFVAGTGTSWAEAAILSSPEPLADGAALALTVIKAASIATTINATGRFTITITPDSPIAAGTHLWLALGMKIGSGGTLGQFLGSRGDNIGSGFQRFRAGERPSTQAGAQDYTATLVASRNWAFAYRWALQGTGGIGGGGTSIAFTVKADDVLVDDGVNAIDFGDGLDVTESPSHEINVAIASAWLTSFINDLISELEGGEASDPGNWMATHRFSSVLSIPGSTTIQSYGMSSGAASGSISNRDDADGGWLGYSTTTLNAVGGRGEATGYWADWGLTYILRMKTLGFATSVRHWIGMSSASSATLGGSDAPTHACAMFRYSTSAGDTNWKCVTSDRSGSQTITDSGVAFAANTAYSFRIIFGTQRAKFYINGVLVATHDVSNGDLLPGSGATSANRLGWYVQATNLVGGALSDRGISLGRLGIGQLN